VGKFYFISNSVSLVVVGGGLAAKAAARTPAMAKLKSSQEIPTKKDSGTVY
jgi:hypothetical protein